MKKILVVLTALFMMSATVVFAATPLAPVFSLTAKATKVAEGDIWSQSGKQLVVDGTNVYVGFSGPNGVPSVIRSTDGGLTWGNAAILAASGIPSTVRIAVAKDPLNVGKKIVSAVWGAMDAEGNMVLWNSFYLDRPTLTSWSTPTIIAGVSIGFVDPNSTSIAAAPDGSIHLIFNNSNGNLYYWTAASADSNTNTPQLLPWGSGTSNHAITVDSSNSIHAVSYSPFGANFSMDYHKKAAGSSTWSTVSVAVDDPSQGLTVSADNVSIAAYDSNNIYIAFKQTSSGTLHVWLAATTNGGNTWTKRIVTPNANVYGTHPSIAVNATKVVAIAGYYEAYGPTARVSVNKTSDNGLTWSPSTNVIGNATPNIAVDSTQRFCVLSVLQEVTDPFINGSMTDIYGPRAIYFTKEK